MSKQLYEEALAEVRQLKQLAEDNAKKAILDEVAPKIKQLIEAQLMGEGPEAEDVHPGAEGNVLYGSKEADEVVKSCSECGVALNSDVKEGVCDECAALDRRAKDASLADEALRLSAANENILRGLAKKNSIHEFKNFVLGLGVKTRSLNEASDKSAVAELIKGTYVLLRESFAVSPQRTALEALLNTYYKKVAHQEKQMKGKSRSLLEAALNIKIDGFKDEDLDSDTLDSLKIEIVPDTAEAAEAESDADEDESPESGDEAAGEEGEDLEDLLGGTEGGESEEEETKKEGKNRKGNNIMEKLAMLSDDTVVEIDEGMLRREIARMKALREGKVEGKSAVGNKMTSDVLAAFGGGKDEGDAFVEGEVTTESLAEVDAMDEASYDLDEIVKELEEMDGEDTDAMGRGEEEKKGKTAHHVPAHNVPAHDEEGEDEEDGMNEEAANTDLAELGNRRKGEEQGELAGDHHMFTESFGQYAEARKVAALRARRAEKVMEAAQKAGNKDAFAKAKKVYTESVAAFNSATQNLRALNETTKASSNSSAAAETAALRKQLAETNLFNAKLLYTNKLLQNESLTPRQKVSIIEKLDEARSLREAKLVYESLTRTLASGTNRVNEGAERRVLGSSSAVARPASTVSLNEGVETARWAKLAGITK